MASKQMTYVEVEEAAEAIAIAVGSKSFEFTGQRLELVTEDERDEWRAVARVAIAIHRAQQA